MKLNETNSLRRIMLVLMMMGVIFCATTPAIHASSSSDDDGLVGSWSGTFTPAPEDPAQFPPLPALFTFTSDGTLTETDGGSLASPSAQPFSYGSPGHGVWRRSGDRKYSIKFLLLAVNPDGTLQVTGTVQLKLTLDRSGNSFHGSGHYEFALPDGTVVFAGDELIEARRIKLGGGSLSSDGNAREDEVLTIGRKSRDN